MDREFENLNLENPLEIPLDTFKSMGVAIKIDVHLDDQEFFCDLVDVMGFHLMFVKMRPTYRNVVSGVLITQGTVGKLLIDPLEKSFSHPKSVFWKIEDRANLAMEIEKIERSDKEDWLVRGKDPRSTKEEEVKRHRCELFHRFTSNTRDYCQKYGCARHYRCDNSSGCF